MCKKTLNNTIAFQGVPGAYSEMACLTNFKNMKTLACPSFEEMISRLVRGGKKNSIDGYKRFFYSYPANVRRMKSSEVIDLLSKYKFRII